MKNGPIPSKATSWACSTESLKTTIRISPSSRISSINSIFKPFKNSWKKINSPGLKKSSLIHFSPKRWNTAMGLMSSGPITKIKFTGSAHLYKKLRTPAKLLKAFRPASTCSTQSSPCSAFPSPTKSTFTISYSTPQTLNTCIHSEKKALSHH